MWSTNSKIWILDNKEKIHIIRQESDFVKFDHPMQYIDWLLEKIKRNKNTISAIFTFEQVLPRLSHVHIWFFQYLVRCTFFAFHRWTCSYYASECKYLEINFLFENIWEHEIQRFKLLNEVDVIWLTFNMTKIFQRINNFCIV